VGDTFEPRPLFLSACGGILVFGIVFAVLGTVFGLPAMRTRLQIDLAQQGNLFLILYLGIFCASLVVGPAIDHFGHKPNLFLSSVIVVLAMLIFAEAQSFVAALFAAVLLGLGGGGLNTGTNVLVSELYGEERGAMLNILGIFFGFGAISVPLLAASIEGHLTISQLFLMCAVLAAACAAAYALLSFPAATSGQAFSLRKVYDATRNDGVLVLAFVLFLESGNEASIGGWTSTYVGGTGYSPRTATLVLAVFWAALMLSRMFAARLLYGMGKPQMVLANGLISLVGCGILLSTRSLLLLFSGTTLIGLAYGPIFPTTLAIAGDRYRERAGTVFGLLFSIALIGGMLFPWMVGQFSQRVSVRAGMVVPAVGAIGIILLALVLTSRKQDYIRISKADDAGF
jgi:MFS transporter, FHS family, glucose/mannose:H+ symporter